MSLQIAKKGSGATSVSYAEALEVALCYGWIDGQKLPLDGRFWLQRFTPRRPKSVWSRINTQKAEALIAQGKMQPAGLKQVEAAKADGRWAAAYASQRSAAPPDDFLAELDKNPRAKAFFATLNSVNRYAIYYRIQSAKKPETRDARIAKFVAMLADHQTLH
ncbi:MAG TPA: YdeI/OmpD-associated family protein [Chloroflexota bacterium]|nr:YdeI/OmpD-associated family protein [Chloroflexota bacterium]